MNKICILGLGIMIIALISMLCAMTQMKEETKFVKCVDGNENLIKNLPDDIVCEEKYNVLFGSEEKYDFFVKIIMAFGIIGFIIGVIGICL